jgi:hypothetical protein
MQKLPEVIRIPFEEGVSDITLEGWEDDWFSTATFNPNVQGFLKEPKIDFVYNCELHYHFATEEPDILQGSMGQMSHSSSSATNSKPRRHSMTVRADG